MEGSHCLCWILLGLRFLTREEEPVTHCWGVLRTSGHRRDQSSPATCLFPQVLAVLFLPHVQAPVPVDSMDSSIPLGTGCPLGMVGGSTGGAKPWLGF